MIWPIRYEDLTDAERAELLTLGIGIEGLSGGSGTLRLTVYEVKSRKRLATMAYLGTADEADEAVRALAGLIARNRVNARTAGDHS